MTILTFREAAQFLRISERHLRELIRRTDIPRRQAGRKARIFFVRERLISWWDLASIPTPISVRIDTFKLLKRSRAVGRVPLNTMRRSLRHTDTKAELAEIEVAGGPILRSLGHLPAPRQE